MTAGVLCLSIVSDPHAFLSGKASGRRACASEGFLRFVIFRCTKCCIVLPFLERMSVTERSLYPSKTLRISSCQFISAD